MHYNPAHLDLATTTLPLKDTGYSRLLCSTTSRQKASLVMRFKFNYPVGLEHCLASVCTAMPTNRR